MKLSLNVDAAAPIRHPQSALVTSQLMIRTSILVTSLAVGAQLAFAEPAAKYAGVPYGDAQHPASAQLIPGTVQCAFYDTGGEGVAFHDSDSVNNGSGKLNPANGTYLDEFRIKEAVDISYTKFHDAIDRNPFNQVQPAENQLYVGWTEPGEWFNLTVHVTEAGRYTLDILCTAAVDGEISIDVDQKPAVTALKIASTFAAAETIKWRNWHHWALAKNAATLELSRGDHVLTVHIVSGGNMNLSTFEFLPTK
jgi:hypothetical protein